MNINCKVHGKGKAIATGFDYREDNKMWIQYSCKKCIKHNQKIIRFQLRDRPSIGD